MISREVWVASCDPRSAAGEGRRSQILLCKKCNMTIGSVSRAAQATAHRPQRRWLRGCVGCQQQQQQQQKWQALRTHKIGFIGAASCQAAPSQQGRAVQAGSCVWICSLQLGWSSWGQLAAGRLVALVCVMCASPGMRWPLLLLLLVLRLIGRCACSKRKMLGDAGFGWQGAGGWAGPEDQGSPVCPSA